MNNLEPVYETTQLQRGAVYQINGTLYQYQYPDPYARIDHPRFCFRCLDGQRRKADLVLNKNTIRKAYLVPGYKAQRGSQVIGEAIQQSLF
ncbi:MAG: hypothetical protein KME28_13115 [Pelatocladus maniniholoensis HA4357-MV3]|jgi:hypothetical protein|uniref:Uncharacterized protein n=1 Tax=Pelatocladus maniniholoensis HA4357-MV3 TaxID=1117104 RepID=A0A9E3H8M7_9NOST|nr:hypothetical protein [Pelatocladus maniniholoensis HA4357-MV3]BAZ65556.1 hypothetical protein NIES4106_02950 [Fischerella sp. NIES-4106]